MTAAPACAVAVNSDYQFIIAGTVTGAILYGARYCGSDLSCSSVAPYTGSVSFLALTDLGSSLTRDGNLFTFSRGGGLGDNYYGSFLFDDVTKAFSPLSLNYSFYNGAGACNFSAAVCSISASTTRFQVIQTRGADGLVPEPATWALLLAGFGAVGYALRRQRSQNFVLSFG